MKIRVSKRCIKKYSHSLKLTVKHMQEWEWTALKYRLSVNGLDSCGRVFERVNEFETIAYEVVD